MPVRRYEPVVIIPRASKYEARHDFGIEDSLNRADYLSSAVLEDTYDAANRSRGKDNALLRDVKAAIRPSSASRESTPTRAGRQSKRFRSLPPVDIKPTATSKALVPYRSPDRVKAALASGPSPSSLLSSRINSYLRSSSLPPHSPSRDIGSNISYKSLLSGASRPADSIGSHISYRSYLSDPSVTSPFTTRSTSRLYPGYTPPNYSSYRSTSPYTPKFSYDYGDDNDDNDDDYEPETSYRRKYKIVQSPPGSPYGTGVRRIGQPAITYPVVDEGIEEEDEEYVDVPDQYGTYSSPRPSGTPSLKLSSYDGDYDGSYEADMAEMYDYVPFGPSRQGILELTEHAENDEPYSYPSSSLIRVPRLSSPPLTGVSTIPMYSKYLDKPLTQPTPSSAVLDSLISSTAARARKVLADSTLPDYKNASLVLSVEGSALSEDGKNRYGFRYYPPPIPLKGSHIGLDERILGVVPKPISPADSFLSNYLNKLRDIRTEVRDQVDRGEYARGRSVAPARRPTTYDHHTVHMPVTISGRAHSVPVSSYRSRLDDGQSHRVDVYPLVVSETTLPSDKKLHLPVYTARGGAGRSSSPTRLTVLEKINIKVDTETHVNPRVSAVSRRVRASTVPPASRLAPAQHIQQQTYAQVAQHPLLSRQLPAGPVYILLAPSSRNSYINSNIPASKPVVLSQAESPWYLRARAGSVPPPQTARSARAASVPPPRSRRPPPAYVPVPQALPTSRLKASRPTPQQPDGYWRARARSLEPVRRANYRDELESQGAVLPTSTLWAHRPMPLRKDISRLARARVDENERRRFVPTAFRRAASLPRYYERASDYYPPIPDVKDVALSRYLYAHRGRFGPESKPPRPSLANFPQVYVPWRGQGPSNRSKAAIIGSRLEGAEGGKRQRRPRSEFAANKLREMKRDEIEEGVYSRVPYTSSLQASKPPLPKLTERKAIRDVDGFTKPRNVMSWQPIYYNLRASTPPSRVKRITRVLERPMPPPIYVPPVRLSSPKPMPIPPVKIRAPEPTLERPKTPSTASVGGSSVNIPAYYAAGGDPNNRPVSDLRRRIRRTIARAKNNPDYYRE